MLFFGSSGPFLAFRHFQASKIVKTAISDAFLKFIAAFEHRNLQKLPFPMLFWRAQVLFGKFRLFRASEILKTSISDASFCKSGSFSGISPLPASELPFFKGSGIYPENIQGDVSMI